MPLSEQEQRLLDEIERHLMNKDADVVSAAASIRRAVMSMRSRQRPSTRKCQPSSWLIVLSEMPAMTAVRSLIERNMLAGRMRCRRPRAVPSVAL